MVIAINSFSLFLVFALLAVVPVYLSVRDYALLKNILVSISVFVLVVVIFAWWGDYSPEVRLKMMGYNLEGMSESERLYSVPNELKQEATRIYNSLFGIGWPLKAILAIIYNIIPYMLYILFVSVTVVLLKKLRTRKST